MTVASASSRDEIENLEGTVLVRRFTNGLNGQTTLERATISAQQEQDAENKKRMDERMRTLMELRGLVEDEEGRLVRNLASHAPKANYKPQ